MEGDFSRFPWTRSTRQYLSAHLEPVHLTTGRRPGPGPEHCVISCTRAVNTCRCQSKIVQNRKGGGERTGYSENSRCVYAIPYSVSGP
jgi:hypothetical protein